MKRTSRSPWILGCAALLACATAGSPAPRPHPDPIEALDLGAWRRAEIAGLTIYTNAPNAEARRVLRRMDQFVAFLSDFLGDFRVDGDPVALRPTDVFLFAREEQLRLFTPNPDETGIEVAGYVTEHFPRSSLASSVRATAPALSVFRHELVHVVHASVPGRHPPRWAQEGLAIYFSTITLRSDVLTLGGRSEELGVARRYPQPLRLAELFSWEGEEPIEVDRFYADSWTFVHYGLHSGVLGGPDRTRAFRDFLDRVERGERWEPALEAAFGAPLAVVEAEFRAHRQRLLEAELGTVVHLTVPIPDDAAIVFEPVPEREIAGRLAGLAMQAGDWAPEARRLLYDFLLAGDEHDPEALAGRMRVAVLDGDLALAARLWERVPVDARASRAALLARAELAQARWRENPPDRRDRAGFFEARDAWVRVLAEAPDPLPALVALGKLYVDAKAEDPGVGLDALRRAAKLDPHQRSIRLDLARLLLRAGDVDTARRELEPLAASGSGESTREARRLLRSLP